MTKKRWIPTDGEVKAFKSGAEVAVLVPKKVTNPFSFAADIVEGLLKASGLEGQIKLTKDLKAVVSGGCVEVQLAEDGIKKLRKEKA